MHNGCKLSNIKLTKKCLDTPPKHGHSKGNCSKDLYIHPKRKIYSKPKLKRFLLRRNVIITGLILRSVHHRVLIVVRLEGREVEIWEALNSLFFESLEARQEVTRIDILKGLRRPEL
jgi:hypothetical protein